jgi:hypothetical protein
VGVVIEMIVTAASTKVFEVLTATEEKVVAVFVSTRKTEVHYVGQTSSPTYPATVADQMQPILQLWRIRCKQHLPPMFSIY